MRNRSLLETAAHKRAREIRDRHANDEGLRSWLRQTLGREPSDPVWIDRMEAGAVIGRVVTDADLEPHRAAVRDAIPLAAWLDAVYARDSLIQMVANQLGLPLPTTEDRP